MLQTCHCRHFLFLLWGSGSMVTRREGLRFSLPCSRGCKLFVWGAAEKGNAANVSQAHGACGSIVAFLEGGGWSEDEGVHSGCGRAGFHSWSFWATPFISLGLISEKQVLTISFFHPLILPGERLSLTLSMCGDLLVAEHLTATVHQRLSLVHSDGPAPHTSCQDGTSLLCCVPWACGQSMLGTEQRQPLCLLLLAGPSAQQVP